MDGSSEFSNLCGEEQFISVPLGYHRYRDQGGAIDWTVLMAVVAVVVTVAVVVLVAVRIAGMLARQTLQ